MHAFDSNKMKYEQKMKKKTLEIDEKLEVYFFDDFYAGWLIFFYSKKDKDQL
jgi:hypothetical protein